jgi:hypothetical protein
VPCVPSPPGRAVVRGHGRSQHRTQCATRLRAPVTRARVAGGSCAGSGGGAAGRGEGDPQGVGAQHPLPARHRSRPASRTSLREARGGPPVHTQRHRPARPVVPMRRRQVVTTQPSGDCASAHSRPHTAGLQRGGCGPTRRLPGAAHLLARAQRSARRWRSRRPTAGPLDQRHHSCSDVADGDRARSGSPSRAASQAPHRGVSPRRTAVHAVSPVRCGSADADPLAVFPPRPATARSPGPPRTTNQGLPRLCNVCPSESG